MSGEYAMADEGGGEGERSMGVSTTLDASKNGRDKEYAPVVAALAPVLRGLPPKLVAIGGLPCSGKTTLGRFLAWWFNVSLIETDLFRDLGKWELIHKNDQIAAIIEHRFNSNNPIIIEGATVLRLLSQLNLRPDFYVHVDNKKIQKPLSFKSDIKAYYQEFGPRERADFTLALDHNG